MFNWYFEWRQAELAYRPSGGHMGHLYQELLHIILCFVWRVLPLIVIFVLCLCSRIMESCDRRRGPYSLVPMGVFYVGISIITRTYVGPRCRICMVYGEGRRQHFMIASCLGNQKRICFKVHSSRVYFGLLKSLVCIFKWWQL